MHVFVLLGDPVRFRIVEILASGPHTAGLLADAVGHEFGITRSAVSHQLRILREAGFVTVEHEDNVRMYRLAWDALEQVDRVLIDLYERWDRRTGWPYSSDPLAPRPRRHRLGERARVREPIHRDEIEPRAPYVPYDDSGFDDPTSPIPAPGEPTG